MSSKYGFTTEQDRENDKRKNDGIRDRHYEVIKRIHPVIMDILEDLKIARNKKDEILQSSDDSCARNESMRRWSLGQSNKWGFQGVEIFFFGDMQGMYSLCVSAGGGSDAMALKTAIETYAKIKVTKLDGFIGGDQGNLPLPE